MINNRYTREYERGEVYLIEKAGATHIGGKRPARPGIIVSSDEVNRESSFVSVVYTTDKETVSPYAVGVALERPSVALCEHVEKVSKGNVGNFLKRLSKGEMERISMALREALDLNGPRCAVGKGGHYGKSAEVIVVDEMHRAPKFEIAEKEEPFFNTANLERAKASGAYEEYKERFPVPEAPEKVEIEVFAKNGPVAAMNLCLAEARAEAKAWRDAYEMLLKASAK